MLIDELITELAPLSCADIRPLLPCLKSAQKFTLTPEFTAVAETLSEDYGGLVKVFSRCRLPYAQTWIEFAQADRPRFSAAGIQIPQAQKTPKRIGFLVSATRDDLSAWKTHLFWNFEHKPYANGVALCAMAFDMTQPINHFQHMPNEAKIDRSRTESGLIKFVSEHPGWLNASESVKLIMSNHTNIAVPDFEWVIPEELELNRRPDRQQRFGAIVRDLAQSDWAGEAAYLLAVIGLLNARNAVETETVDHHKLNRARIKNGKLPLFEHKILKIARRQRRRVFTDGVDTRDYAPMRGHFVRGHFKARATGIYFWHPHARGDFHRGKVEKDYEVVE